MDKEYFDPARKEEEKIKTFSQVLSAHQEEGVGMLEGNINDFIAAITIIARHNPELVKMNKDTENEISILTYLRDDEKYKAKTGKESFNLISESKVDSKVVELWIEEKMTDSPNIKNSIEKGYPDLTEKSKKNK